MRDREERESLENTRLLNRYDFARASKAIDRYARMGYGLDGMPLQRGQSPLSRPREPKNQGGVAET